MPTWTQGVALLQQQATQLNRGVPRVLTNEQAATMIMGLLGLSPKAGHPFPSWYELALPTLGYYKQGQKFRVDEVWAKKVADPAVTEMIWRATEQLAGELDSLGVPFTAPDLRPSRAKLMQLAALAWERMKKTLPKVPNPPRKVPVPPPLVPPPPSLNPFSGGVGKLLIIGGLVWYFTKGKK